MIPHEEALDRIRSHVRPLETEQVPTRDCAGRVLASDLATKVSSPPFNKSAMDGYAVRERDVANLPVELDLVGESYAGQWPAFTVGPGQCSVITTGAPLPAGADWVVMVEQTNRTPEGKVRIEGLSGRNVCAQGEDMAQGDTVLRTGQLLTPLRVGVAAAAGHDSLLVYRKPSVSLLCTGTEVVEPPDPVAKGQIYNSNGPILMALLKPDAEKFDYLGLVGDRPKALEAALRQGLDSDLFVITGGVSVGALDLVPESLQRLGVEIVFHKCAIKPGKPALLGVHEKGYVFGVPGNPFSCFAVYHVLMRAVLARMANAWLIPPVMRSGIMRHDFKNKPGRKNFKPCRVIVEEGVNRIELVRSHGSADITGGSEGNALVAVPADATHIEAGQMMKYIEV